MKVTELAQKIREQGLTKDQLEDYYTELVSLFAIMSERLADLEKQEAIFMGECKEPTAVGAKRKWKATESGLELIVLKRNIKAVEKLASSVKHRIYNYL